MPSESRLCDADFAVFQLLREAELHQRAFRDVPVGSRQDDVVHRVDQGIGRSREELLVEAGDLLSLLDEVLFERGPGVERLAEAIKKRHLQSLYELGELLLDLLELATVLDDLLDLLPQQRVLLIVQLDLAVQLVDELLKEGFDLEG